MPLLFFSFNGIYYRHTVPFQEHPNSLTFHRNHLRSRRQLITTVTNPAAAAAAAARYLCFFDYIPKIALVKIHRTVDTTDRAKRCTEGKSKVWNKAEKQGRGDGIHLKVLLFSFSTLSATFSSIHEGLFLNNPTLGFHHSFEMIHVPLSNICLLFQNNNSCRLDGGNDPPAPAFCHSRQKPKTPRTYSLWKVAHTYEKGFFLSIVEWKLPEKDKEKPGWKIFLWLAKSDSPLLLFLSVYLVLAKMSAWLEQVLTCIRCHLAWSIISFSSDSSVCTQFH